MKTLPEILRAMLDNYYDYITERDIIKAAHEYYEKTTFTKAQEAIAKELMGIIGEDEPNPAPNEAWGGTYRNEHRAEQRARLTAFIGYKEK